jgi:hypothetical protein
MTAAKAMKSMSTECIIYIPQTHKRHSCLFSHPNIYSYCTSNLSASYCTYTAGGNTALS